MSFAISCLPLMARDMDQAKNTPAPPTELPKEMIRTDAKGRLVPLPLNPDRELANPVHSEAWLDG